MDGNHRMICVLCGKEGTAYRGMCSECAAESVKIEFPAKMEYTICPKCGAYRVNRKWVYDHQERALKKQMLSSVKLPDKAFSAGDPELKEVSDQMSEFNVTVTSDEGFSFTRSTQVIMRGSLESCPVCDRKSGSYFEAILQIRFEDPQNTDFLDDLLGEVGNVPDPSDPNQFISKFVQLPEGIDVYLGSRKLAERMVKHISASYPGYRQNSKTIAGRKDGKDIYRFTYMYRIFNPKSGTILKFNDRILCLKKIENDRLMFSSGLAEAETSVNYQDLTRKGYKILKSSPEILRMMVVSREPGNTTLMDLETYDTTVVRSELPLREITLSKYNDSFFLVR